MWQPKQWRREGGHLWVINTSHKTFNRHTPTSWSPHIHLHPSIPPAVWRLKLTGEGRGEGRERRSSLFQPGPERGWVGGFSLPALSLLSSFLVWWFTVFKHPEKTTKPNQGEGHSISVIFTPSLIHPANYSVVINHHKNQGLSSQYTDYTFQAYMFLVFLNYMGNIWESNITSTVQQKEWSVC